MPVDLPQTIHYTESGDDYRIKLRWFFKAQLVPTETNFVINQWGKSKLRCRERIHVSPVRPIVNDPCFNTVIPFEKKVGLYGSKTASMQVTMSKNFYLANETAYIMVDIDNSRCENDCELIISQKSKLKLYQNHHKESRNRSHKKEKFFLARAGESK